MGPVGSNEVIPLAAFAKVDTSRPDEAEDAVGRIFCSHKLGVQRRGAPGFRAIHNHAGHEGYSVNYVAYGADVTIDPGRLDRFFLLQIPLSGGAEVRCGTRLTETGVSQAGPARASLLSPTLETRMRWREGTGQLIVLVERGRVERHFGALTGRAPQPVEFEPGVALDTAIGAAILAQARLMLSLSEEGRGRAFGLAHQHLRDTLIAQMLTFLPHGLSHRLAAPASGAAPAHIRRAEEFIAAHAGKEVSLDRLAEVAGVSLRTLQAGFRRFRDTTIGDAIQATRLTTWHRLLADPQRQEGVVELALEAGITHPGRHASTYFARFGENPSETRRSARRTGGCI